MKILIVALVALAMTACAKEKVSCEDAVKAAEQATHDAWAARVEGNFAARVHDVNDDELGDITALTGGAGSPSVCITFDERSERKCRKQWQQGIEAVAEMAARAQAYLACVPVWHPERQKYFPTCAPPVAGMHEKCVGNARCEEIVKHIEQRSIVEKWPAPVAIQPTN